MNRRRSTAVRLLVAAVAAAAGPVLLLEPGPVRAASLQNPPERLYVGERGATYQILPVPYPVPVPIGLLTFDGSPDPISSDPRAIVVQTGDGPAPGCVIEDDPDVGDADFVIGGCSRVVLNVVHGRIWMGLTQTMYRDNPDGTDNLDSPAFMYATGAILDSFGAGDSDTDPNLPAGYGQLEINGTQQELNDTLAQLIYIPDDDYHFTASAPEERLAVSVSPADGTPSVQHSVEIRVLDDNDWPTLDGPSMEKMADPELPLSILTEFTVGDIDNDEAIDDDTGDPLKDGVYTEMLLIGYLDCGADPTVDLQTGVRYQGGSFDTTATDLADLMTRYFEDRDSADSDLPQIAMAVSAVLDGIEAIPGVPAGITTLPLSNHQSTDYQDFFVGIGDDIEELQFALDGVTFLHDVGGANCRLWTIVSDLGNNGLPLQYFGSPPAGFELPFIGVDYNEFEINVSEPEELDISWDSATFVIVEADPGDMVPAIDPSVTIDPAIHPEFGFLWTAVPGTATGPPTDSDYQGSQSGNETIVENTATWTLDDINLAHDELVEGDEQFTIEITPPTAPPGRPDGWVVKSDLPTVTVIIIDDDDALKQVSVADASVGEGDSGTTNMVFTLDLGTDANGPVLADGNEEVTISLVEGSAETPADYGAPAATSVAFAAGASTATVSVPIVGDVENEGDHSFMLNLGNPQNVIIADGAATGTIVDDDLARTVTVADVMMNEGDSGTTPMQFTLQLSQPAKVGDSVVVSTADASAVAPGDYGAIVGQIVPFVAGQTEVIVTVDIVGDTTVEPTQSFELTIADPSGITIDDGAALGTIVNDDGVPAASIADVSVAEGDVGTVAATFTVSLSVAAPEVATVQVETSSGTGTVGVDFASQSTTVSFDVGETTKTVSVAVNGDTDAELNETYLVDLDNPLGVTIADAQAVGTITNDDITVTLPAAQAVAEGDTGMVALTISPAIHPPFSLTATTADGTAIAITDYTALAAQPVNVAADAVSATVDLDTVENLLVDGDRTFTLSAVPLSPVGFTVRIEPSSTAVTIVDDDVPSIVSIADATVTEAVGNDQLTISMTNFVGRTCQLIVTTADATAVAPDDYAPITAANFDMISTATDVLSLTIVDDGAVEPDEAFAVSIELASGADPRCQLGNSLAEVTVVSDDIASFVSIDDSSITEGLAGSTTLTMTNPLGRFCQVAVTSTDGTAVAPGDYDALNGSNFDLVSMASGVLSLSAADDDSVEGPESFTLSIALTSASHPQCALGDASATILVVDTDTPVDVTSPSVTVAAAAGQESPTLDMTIVFSAQFSEPVVGFSTGDVTVTGTAGATTHVVTAVDLDTYEIAVTGMMGSGTVSISIAAGVANDAAGNDNTASNAATVQYLTATEPISLSVPADIVRNNDPGQPGAIVTYPAATSSGGIPPVLVACNQESGAFYPIGTTTVTCTATDSAGDNGQTLLPEATASASFTIQIIDAEPPSIADLPDLIRQISTSAPVIVTFGLPAATDNSGVPPTVGCAPASGSMFVVGVATVTCTATDGAGLTASSSFTVTVSVTSDGGSGVVPPGGGLPATGTDPFWLAIVGLLLLATGATLVRIRRRRIAG